MSEFFDSIDALGSDDNRFLGFKQELLSNAEDETLKSITESAANDLAAPISLVNLVLDHIQFFKAHYGLPADLAAARGTPRNVSFCQFVVRDGEPFEVTDAENDPRVPQTLVKLYDIKAYLGMPILADGKIVGSLCVIDNKPRQFTDQDRLVLKRLSEKVNDRLAAIIAQEHRPSSKLIELTAAPALAESHEALMPIQNSIDAGRLSATAIQPLLNLIQYQLNGGTPSRELMLRSLSAAQKGVDDLEDGYFDIEASLGDTIDAITALQNVFVQSYSTPIFDAALSARELARYATEPIGGSFLPDIAFNPFVKSPRSLAVSLMANALASIAQRMMRYEKRGGIRMEVQNLGSAAGVAFETVSLPPGVTLEIARELEAYARQVTGIEVEALEHAIQLRFDVLFDLT